MFQTDLTIQPQLFGFSPRDMVADDSDVWLYVDLFDALDLEEFDYAYSCQGQAAKDPKLMLRTIFYGLAHGNVSGRALATASFCEGCPHQTNCRLFSKKGRIYTIRKRSEWSLVQANRKRLQGAGRGVFKRRKAIVEPVFGNVKTKGLKILVTGKAKVTTWWIMVCLALNLEKIIGHLATIRQLPGAWLNKNRIFALSTY